MRVWWAVVVLCVPIVAAEWFAVDADLDVRGAARFDGDADVRMVFSGSMLDAHDDPLANGRLEATGDWTYTYYEVTERYVEGSDGSALGTRRVDLSRDLEILDEGAIEGALSTEGLDPAFSLRAFEYEGRPVNWSTSFALGPPSDPHTYYGSKRSVEVVDDPRTTLPDRGARWLPDQNIGMEGDFRFQLYGTRVSADGRTFPTGVVDEERVEAPDGTTRVDTLVHRILVLEGPGKANLVGQWTHYVTSLEGRLGGSLEIVQARGRADVNGSEVDQAPQLFHVIGDVESIAKYHDASSHWRIQGSASFVSVNAVPVEGSWPQAELAATAIAVGLLVAWAWISGAAREALLVIGLRHADPLGNENRLQILSQITRMPGISLAMLQEATSLSRATVSHHLRILLRHQLVSCIQEGKISAWTLNSGSMEFPLSTLRAPPSEESSLLSRDAFARTGHPTRRQMLQAIADEGPLGYDQLAERLRADDGRAAISPATLSYHAQILEETGLISKERRGRRVEWRATVSPKAVIEEQLVRFLRGHDVKETLARLVEGCATPGEAPVPLREGPRWRKKHLRLLRGLGLIENGAGGNPLRLAPEAVDIARKLERD